MRLIGRRSRVASAVALIGVLVIVGCATGTSAGARTAAGSAADGSAPKEAVRCDNPATRTTVAYRHITGVDPDLTSVDVYPVVGMCGAPVVMWVHGGGYRTGDKANKIRDKVRLFRSRGWVSVSVNYRLTRRGQPGSARFPQHYDDVAASVAWVNANIESYGGDPSRIALLGHSAGADIVSNVATNPTYLGRRGLDLSTLGCAGPLDTEGFDKAAARSRAQWQAALGNNPDYVAETSATLLIEQGVGIPPIIGVVRGSPRRQRIESAFLAALRSAGIQATSIDARSLTHNQVSTSIGAPGDQVMTAPVVRFLTRCFR